MVDTKAPMTGTLAKRSNRRESKRLEIIPVKVNAISAKMAIKIAKKTVAIFEG